MTRLRAAQARAVALLRTHERELSALTDALLEHDTLSAAEVDELLANAARPSWKAQLASALGAKDVASALGAKEPAPATQRATA